MRYNGERNYSFSLYFFVNDLNKVKMLSKFHVCAQCLMSCCITIGHTDNDSVNVQENFGVVIAMRDVFSAHSKRQRDKPTCLVLPCLRIE